MKSPITDHYTVTVKVDITPRNQYNDAIGDNVVTYTGNTKAKTIGDIGRLLERIQEAITNE